MVKPSKDLNLKLMKNYIFVLIAAGLLVACEKEATVTNPPAENNTTIVNPSPATTTEKTETNTTVTTPDKEKEKKTETTTTTSSPNP